MASSDAALALMAVRALRLDLIRYEPELVVVAERERARVGAWYELFVRSQDPAGGAPAHILRVERGRA